MIVLDTSILSHVYRRAAQAPGPVRAVAVFVRLLEDDEPMAVPSIVLQEVLSGVKTAAAFARLDDVLSGFPLLLPTREIHVRAARLRSQCRVHGIAAATVDCLIAAHTLVVGGQLFTVDEDFAWIAKHSDLELLSI